MSTVSVPLSGGRGYTIHIEPGLLKSCRSGEIVAESARSRRAVIVSQPNVARRWAAPLLTSLKAAGFGDVPVVTFPNGERYKTLATMTALCDKLYHLPDAVDRKTVLIALGGGVVGDVAGFLAAMYLRGLDYVQVPTTLLAMVDSSVGGKTGVDLLGGKNLVGAFHQPRAVLIDPETLTTLPLREKRAGMAEVIKYGVIADPSLLEDAQKTVGYGAKSYDPDVMDRIVRRSCEIKADVVVRDEFETTGLRAILNFGHTVGHAAESATQYRRFRHGEAVAMGMMAAAYIGEEHGVTPPAVAREVGAALIRHGLPTAVPEDVTPEQILPLLGRDKKAEAGRAKFVLARALGDVSLYSDVSDEAMRRGLARAYVPFAEVAP